MRKIPATMATQHPDNAAAPYWDGGSPFISVYQEINEAIHNFQDLGVSEYMWDWEGKHADAAVIDRLFTNYHDYFAKQQLGRDKFLTFRIPNIWEEKGYNLLQAMTVVLSSEDFARDLKFHGRPLFEVILPMTERADQLMHMHKLFEKLAKFKSTEFTTEHEHNTDYLELIPLIESVGSQMGVVELLTDYIQAHEAHFGYRPQYIRTFLAGSDSALSSGFLAGILGNKISLARLYEFSEQTAIAIFPIFGCGSLQFRGGLTPEPAELDRFMEEFPGVRTVTVQSAFRYDYPLKMVKAAIAQLEKSLPEAKLKPIEKAEQRQLIDIAEQSAKLYKQTLADVAAGMQPIFSLVPKRRDRRQHIGLVAYGRDLDGQKMPRAITFTAGFYSLGVPPEFIGLGRSLKALSAADLDRLKQHYPNMTADFTATGHWLNKGNLAKFAASSTAWADIQQDIELAEQLLGVEFGPQSSDERQHQKLSAQLTKNEDDARGTELIEQMAVLRKSLG